MLTLAQVLSALDPGDWMVVLDLQDAYFHIPVLQAHRRYLRFTVGQEHFQFAVLLFGLTSALGCSQKLWRWLQRIFSDQGSQSSPYLDNWLLKVGLPQAVVTHLQTMTNLLTSLEFTINLPRSQLTPS